MLEAKGHGVEEHRVLSCTSNIDTQGMQPFILEVEAFKCTLVRLIKQVGLMTTSLNTLVSPN